MALILGMAIALVVTLLVQRLLRVSQLAGWITFGVLPFVLLPWWIQHPVPTFMWIKVYSITVGTCVMVTMRFTRLGIPRWPYTIIYLFLQVNIGERQLFTSDELT